MFVCVDVFARFVVVCVCGWELCTNSSPRSQRCPYRRAQIPSLQSVEFDVSHGTKRSITEASRPLGAQGCVRLLSHAVVSTGAAVVQCAVYTV
jgi:hypothetical protein